MKDKKSITKIVVFTVLFILMFAIILYFSLKGSYATETGTTSSIPESTAKLALNCEGDKNILPSIKKKCTITLNLTNSDVTEVSSISAVISYKNLTGTIKEESYVNQWEGATSENKIDLYTADNKKDKDLLLEFGISATSESPSVASITLSNIIISDEKFDEYKLDDTTFELNIVDNNASLKSLSVGGTSVPEFNPETTNYYLEVAFARDNIEIGAEAQSGATIEGTGIKSLNVGVNTFDVIVTASDKTTKKNYTIKIIRKEESVKDELEFTSDVIVENKYLILKLVKTNECDPNHQDKSYRICYDTDDLYNKIITNGWITVTDSKDNVIDKNVVKKITTGTKVNIKLKSGTSYDYTIIILGDTTGDGVISQNDVTKLFQYYMYPDKHFMSEYSLRAGDVKTDGLIGHNDVAKLFQYYMDDEKISLK